MKADKGNCFVVMDRSDYDSKMETLLNDSRRLRPKCFSHLLSAELNLN